MRARKGVSMKYLGLRVNHTGTGSLDVSFYIQLLVHFAD